MKARTGELYYVNCAVSLHSSPKKLTWSWDGTHNDIITGMLTAGTLFIILGNVRDEPEKYQIFVHEWVCILTNDFKVGWVNRTFFNDNVATFTRLG